MTPLDKDLSRESTVKYDGREIQVTLTADQKISFKLKGMKSGVVSIGIEEVYRQLIDDEKVSFSGTTADAIIIEEEVVDKTNKANKSWLDTHTKDNPMVSLNQLRTKINTSPMSIDTKGILDTFVVECIKTAIKPFQEKEAAEKEAKNSKK